MRNFTWRLGMQEIPDGLWQYPKDTGKPNDSRISDASRPR
jgi:hypothetical protein